MLKLYNDIGEISGQGDYSNPVFFDLDARFAEEQVQMLTLSCAAGCAKNVTVTDSGDSADRYFFSKGGTSWADSVEFATVTDAENFYVKARTIADETDATDRDAKIIVTYELQPAATDFYYSNPGDGDLLAVEGATTFDTTPDKSVTGKAFYGGALADMFYTPDLSEVWMRADIWIPTISTDNQNAFYIGHFGSNGDYVVGIHYKYPNVHLSVRNGGTTERAALSVIRGALNHVTLHIKSGELIEMTANGSTVSWSGNVNNGEPLNNLVTYANAYSNPEARGIVLSNIVVSSSALDSACGFHRDLYSVETDITAPVLNVRYGGEVHKFKLTTKKSAPALTVRVGDRNFYAPLVTADDSLASAVRLNLNDTIYALKT